MGTLANWEPTSETRGLPQNKGRLVVYTAVPSGADIISPGACPLIVELPLFWGVGERGAGGFSGIGPILLLEGFSQISDTRPRMLGFLLLTTRKQLGGCLGNVELTIGSEVMGRGCP
jgi:hypothetical protein